MTFIEQTVLGDRIRAFRQRRGWSQNELASRAGVKQPTLQRIEASKRQDPGFSIVVRLARALGISLDLLAGPESAEGVDSGHTHWNVFPDPSELEARVRRLEGLLGPDATAGDQTIPAFKASAKA